MRCIYIYLLVLAKTVIFALRWKENNVLYLEMTRRRYFLYPSKEADASGGMGMLFAGIFILHSLLLLLSFL